MSHLSPTPRMPVSRQSTLLVDWRGEDLSLVARTRQVGTLTRASTAPIVTHNSLTATLPHSMPRFSVLSGEVGLLIEPAGANSADRFVLPIEFGVPDNLTIYARFVPNWGATSGGIASDAYLWTIGTAVPRLSVKRNSAAGTYTATLDTATTDATQSTAAPVTAIQEVVVQFANLKAGGTVAIDTGSGLSAFSSAATAITAFGSATLIVGGFSTAGELDGLLTHLKVSDDLTSLAGMRTRN